MKFAVVYGSKFAKHVIMAPAIANLTFFFNALTKQPPCNFIFLHYCYQHHVCAHIFMLNQLFQISRATHTQNVSRWQQKQFYFENKFLWTFFATESNGIFVISEKIFASQEFKRILCKKSHFSDSSQFAVKQ